MWRTLQRAVIIVVASAALGLVANTVLPRRIPFIAAPKPKLERSDIVSLDEAKQLWGTGGAFFLDARAPADFNAGHIAGAFSVPAESFEDAYVVVAPMLTPDSALVAYCDGVDCDLSHRLTDRLRQLGYKNVRILVNGWTTWHTANLPVQTGPRT